MADVLTQKRLALEREVEQFKQHKEEEFRRFEEELKTRSDSSDDQESVVKERMNGVTKSHLAEISLSSGPSLAENTKNEGKENLRSQEAFGDVKWRNQEEPGSRAIEKKYEKRNAEQGSRKSRHDRAERQHQDSLMEVNGDQYPISKEDRELELRALFTPTFLPLSEDQSHLEQLQDRNSLTHGSPSESYQRLSQGRLDSDAPQFSSSLTTLPSLSSQRSSAGSISSSHPRLGFSGRRSSSSPTGTGRTLRSSLRSPDHVAKERKHVLFSIDDKVMSPSTSPAATRRIGAVDKKSQRTPTIPLSGLTDFPFPGISASAAMKQTALPSSISMTGAKAVAPPSISSPTRPSRSYKDLVEPTVITPPDEADKQDLQMEESNPMFDLDEPEGNGNDVLDYKEDDSDATSSSREYTREKEESMGADIAASPHRGSVPIEIKWPGRRAS